MVQWYKREEIEKRKQTQGQKISEGMKKSRVEGKYAKKQKYVAPQSYIIKGIGGNTNYGLVWFSTNPPEVMIRFAPRRPQMDNWRNRTKKTHKKVNDFFQMNKKWLKRRGYTIVNRNHAKGTGSHGIRQEVDRYGAVV